MTLATQAVAPPRPANEKRNPNNFGTQITFPPQQFSSIIVFGNGGSPPQASTFYLSLSTPERTNVGRNGSFPSYNASCTDPCCLPFVFGLDVVSLNSSNNNVTLLTSTGAIFTCTIELANATSSGLNISGLSIQPGTGVLNIYLILGVVANVSSSTGILTPDDPASNVPAPSDSVNDTNPPSPPLPQVPSPPLSFDSPSLNYTNNTTSSPAQVPAPIPSVPATTQPQVTPISIPPMPTSQPQVTPISIPPMPTSQPQVTPVPGPPMPMSTPVAAVPTAASCPVGFACGSGGVLTPIGGAIGGNISISPTQTLVIPPTLNISFTGTVNVSGTLVLGVPTTGSSSQPSITFNCLDSESGQLQVNVSSLSSGNVPSGSVALANVNSSCSSAAFHSVSTTGTPSISSCQTLGVHQDTGAASHGTLAVLFSLDTSSESGCAPVAAASLVNPAVVAGAVIGAVVGAAIIVLLVVFLVRSVRRKVIPFDEKLRKDRTTSRNGSLLRS